MTDTTPETPRTDETMQLDDADVELLEASSGSNGEDTAQDPPAPPTGDIEASDGTADDEEYAAMDDDGDADAPDERIDPAAAAARAFFVDEANALAARQPERAAVMWLEAAEVAAQGGGGRAVAVDDLDNALELRGESAWLLPRARRLLMRLGDYERAIKLGNREVKLGGDTATRSAVLSEAAAVVQHALSKGPAALKLVDSAIKLTPRSVFALACAIELRRELDLVAETAAGLENLAECLTDPKERSMCLYAAGTLHEMRLSSPDGARAAYTRASEADPKNVPVLLALCEVHRMTESWPELGRALEHLADLVEDSTFKGRLLRLAGTLYLDVCGDLESAARALGRAARALGDDPGVLSLLAHTQEARGRQRDTVQALRQLLEQTADKEGRAALLAQIAQLHADLHEVEQAIAANREALVELPGYLPALQSLGTLYRQRGDYESLVAISQPETEGLLPAEARAVRCIDLAELLAERLERPEDAVGMYRRAIELAPKMHLGYWALEQHLTRMGWDEELATLLGQHADVSGDEETEAQIRLRRADLEAQQLGRPERALEALETLGDRAVRSATFRRMELYRQTGRHVELVDLLLKQADTTKDASEAEGRRVQAALVLEHELEEHERALEIYKKVLEANSKCHAAIHGTGRILHRLGRWNDLVRLHHHELTSEPDRPDTAVLLCRVGRILERDLGNAGAAIGAYAKALKKDPAYTPALSAVDRLARGEKRWPDLVQVLVRFAEARGEGRAAATAHSRAGEISGWVLGEIDRACELYQSAIDVDPEARAPMDGLLQMRLRQQRWAEAAQTLRELIDRAEGDEERAALSLQLARLTELRLGDLPDLETYDAASGGGFGESLREEMLRVHRRLGSDQARELLLSLGRETSDARLGAAYLLQAAHAMEFSGNRATPVPDDDVNSLLNAARLAHQRQPENAAALWCLERQLVRSESWSELAELHEHEARLELDRTMRVQALARAAQAYHLAGAHDDAERTCRECLNFDVHCLPALRLLADLAKGKEDWAGLAESCDRLAEAAAANDNRLASCLRAASVWQEHVGDESRALASLSVALADDPTQHEAFERAEALLRGRGEFSELSRLYQRRIRATRDDAARVPLLRAHAKLLRDELHHPDRALAELDALLALAPDDTDALRELAALHAKRGHWSDAAAALGLLVERAADADVRYGARIGQANLWLKKLHEPERARAALAACEDERPGEIEAAKLRVELDATVGDWADAREVLEGLAGSNDVDVASRVWAYLRLGEIATTGLHDDALANKSISGALRLSVGKPEALDALRAHYPAPDDKRRVVTAAEALLDERDDPALRRVVAQMLVEDLDDYSRALPHLEAVAKASPDDAEARLLLARALERDRPADACARYRALLEDDPTSIEAYRGLVRSAPTETAAAAATFVDTWAEAGAEETVHLKTLDADVAPRGRFSDGDLPGAADPSFEQAFEMLAPFVDELLSPRGGRPADDSVGVPIARLARTAGINTLGVELVDGSGVGAAMGSTPRLLVGADLAANPRSPWMRFVVGRELLACGPRRLALLAYSGDDLDDLFAAIHERRPAGDQRQALKKTFGRVVPRRTRKQIEQLGPPANSGRFDSTLATLRRAAEPLALVLARNPAAVLRQLAAEGGAGEGLGDVLGNDRLSKLARFALSDDYARKYRTIWG